MVRPENHDQDNIHDTAFQAGTLAGTLRKASFRDKTGVSLYGEKDLENLKLKDVPVHEDERTLVVIDGAGLANMTYRAKSRIDFAVLKRFFSERSKLVSMRYYASLEDARENPVIRIIDFLRFNGYVVARKVGRDNDLSCAPHFRGRCDIDITIDVLAMADRIDHLVLCVGSNDLAPLIAAVQLRGVRVSLMTVFDEASGSDRRTGVPIDEARSQADDIILMSDIGAALPSQRSDLAQD